MASWAGAACIAVCLLACVDGLGEERSDVVVVSADDFMKGLHLQTPPRHREHAVPTRRGHLIRGSSSRSEHRQLGESGGVHSAVHFHRKLARDLTQLKEVSTPETPEQHAAELASAKKHFKKTEEQISGLRKGLSQQEAAVRAAKERLAQSAERYKAKVAEMAQEAGKEEFSMMTDPSAETSAISDDERIQKLQGVVAGDKKKTETELEKLADVKMKLNDKLHDRQVNVKAVRLFNHFKEKYEAKMAHGLATLSAQFHEKAMAGAMKLAQDKFNAYKTKFLQKQEALMDSQLKTQKAERAAKKQHQAEMTAEMDHKARTEATSLFNSYVQRFHEMQEESATSELELGESGQA